MTATDAPDPSDSDTTDDDLRPENLRDEIKRYFGLDGPTARDADRDREGFSRLLEDLESRILGSVRESQIPPPEIGPFILEERIGRGGFAVVYRATHKRTGARAAVKLMPASDKSSQQRIATEVESLIQLRHPNIVRVIDTGEDDGWAWVATDLIPGQTLAEFIRTRRSKAPSFQIGDDTAFASRDDRHSAKPAPIDAATLRLAMTWFRDLAGALSALHAAGLVHRDVKPANILIDLEQRPFLIDFGLSSSAETTVDGILAGTVPYMSPEQTLGGWVAITPRSDIYSLAVTFHEVLTGRRVTQGVARETMLRQIAFVAVAPPSEVAPGVPEELDPIFGKALLKDENGRYASAQQLAEDLDSWLDGRPLKHVTETRRTRVVRTVRHHPIGIVLAVAIFMVLAGWGIQTYVDRKSRYRDVLATARAHQDAGKPRDALTTLAAAAPQYGDRSEFKDAYRAAVGPGGDDMVRELLHAQTFSVGAMSTRSLHARLAGEADQHLRASGAREPRLILVLALSAMFSGKPSEARAVLEQYADVVQWNRPLAECAVIVALDEKNKDQLKASLERLADIPADVTPTAICLSAWRLLYCRGVEGAPNPPAAELDKIGLDLETVLRACPDHGTAWALLGRLKLVRKDYRGAHAAFVEIVKKGGDNAERIGALFMHAVSDVLAAGIIGNETARTEYLNDAISYSRTAIESDSSLLNRFILEVHEAAPRDLAAWLINVLTEPWKRRPTFDEAFFVFAANKIQDAARSAHYPAVVGMADAVEREYGSRAGIAESGNLDAIRRLQVWASHEAAHEVFAAGDRAQVRNFVRRGLEALKRLRVAHPALPYEFLAWEAMLTAMGCARSDSATPAEVADAKARLQNACSEAVIAEEKARTEQEKENIRTLRKHCVDMLGVLAAAESR